MIEQLYPLLILVGSTIGAVMLYLWHQAHIAGHINLRLIQLNEQLNFDTPTFLREAWPLVSQAGLLGMQWRLDWFGMLIEGHSGQTEGHCVSREMEVSEMRLALTLHPKKTRGERRYFNETLVETFLLLLRTDMLIKADATAVTFDRMAKLNLFLQHDMKNVAQFIQLMADQLAGIPPGKELQVLEHLRTAAPLIRQRADHIVRTLSRGPPKANSLITVFLHEKLAELCRLYHLDCTVTGTAEVSAPVNLLDSALDNILKNYNDIRLRSSTVKPLIQITIVTNPVEVEIWIEAKNALPVVTIDRLFEPFWSSDPDGLGIGLYQSRQMLEMCNGTLKAQYTTSGQLQFCVVLPH